jgi:predicted dehydrogenase
MGQHHVRIISQTSDVVLAGFYDPDPLRAQEICDRHGCECFATLEELLDRSDAVTVAAPTSMHFKIGEECLNRGIHVLMEKPLAHELEAAARLVDLSQKTGLVLMVGHVERYNPAVGKLMELLRGDPEEIIN